MNVNDNGKVRSKSIRTRLFSILLTALVITAAMPILFSSSADAEQAPWTVSTIASTTDVGRYTSLAIDSQEKAHISFHDFTGEDLEYITNAGGTWSQVTLEASARPGKDTSIAVDSNDKVHIAYYDQPNNNLKYATNKGGAWVQTSVDTAQNVGLYTSIAIDSNNAVHIAYYDYSNGNLKYTNNAGGSWATAVLDSTGDVGLYTSIEIDSGNTVHITYYDQTNGDLKYATNPGGVWSYITIDTAGIVGEYTSLALDSNDKLHISYWDTSTQHLKYATNKFDCWSMVPIEVSTIAGRYSSIDLDSTGIPHVAFFDATNKDLRFATLTDGAWTHVAVDTEGDVGEYPSLKMDGNDRGHISYYDLTNGDLKYAYQMVMSPTEPTSLDGTAGSSQVSLTWNAPGSDRGSPITGYNIYRGTASGAEVMVDSIGPVLTYTDIGLINGETYWYYVTAVNSAGEGAPSNEISATPLSVPSAPNDLQVNSGDTYAELTWLAPSDDGGSAIQYYVIYRGSSSGTETPLIAVGTMLRYIDAGLINGQTYYYQVRAWNAAGEGAPSNEVSVSPTSTSSAPISLQAIANESNITLVWSAPTNDGGSPITGYVIYRGIASDSLEPYASTSDLTYDDLAVLRGTVYWYYVVAVNAAGEGAASNSVSALIETAPSEPIDLVAIPAAGEVVLDWTAPSASGGLPIIGYAIYRGNSSGNESLYDSVGPVLTYSDLEVVNGNTYWYYVTAINDEGEGNASNEAFATPIGAPSEPLNLTAISGDGTVTLSWLSPLQDGGSSVTGYRIYRGMENGTGSLLVTTGLYTSYIDAGLMNGVTYWYSITALNAAGEGPYSNWTSATPVAIPSAPLWPAVAEAESGALINWTAPQFDGGSAITNYTIYRGTDGGELSLYVVVGDILNYTDMNVESGTTFVYAISATNGAGEGPRSVTVDLTLSTVPTSVQDLVAEPMDSSVRLTWNMPSDDGGSEIIGYRLYRGTTAGSESLYKTLGTELFYVDDDVINGQRYWYSVRAVNSEGTGPSSERVSAVPLTSPSAPTNLVATKDGSTVMLTWGAPLNNGGSAITGYTVFRGTTSGGETMLVMIGNVLTFNDASVEVGTVYYYTVTATNGAWESSESNEVSIMPLTIASDPTGLEGVLGDGNITLTWSVPEEDGGSAITGYAVYRDNGTGAVLISTVEEGLMYIDEDIVDGETYLYYVKAVNSQGEGDPSNTVLVTTPAPEQEGDDGDGWDWVLWFHLILLILIILALLYWYIRKREDGEEEKKP